MEGYGEVSSVPIVIRYLCPRARMVAPPHRLNKGKAFDPQMHPRKDVWEGVFSLLRAQGATAVVVLMDVDRACPKYAAPVIRNTLEGIASSFDITVGFCLATPEYEAWFLESADLLGLGSPPPRIPRDCKGEIRRRMGRYRPTVDQPRLTAHLTGHLEQARRRSSSLDKFCREVEALCQS